MTTEIAKATLRRDDLDPPPSSSPERADVQPLVPLFSPGQVGGATFLGGPLAGVWLMATNYARLRRPRAARWTAIAGVVLTAAYLGLALFLPESIPRAMIWLPGLLVMLSLARQLQGSAFADHVQRGGPLMSNWNTVGRGVVALVLTLGLVMGGAFGVDLATRPDSVQFGDSQVFHDEGASSADAARVGAVLEKRGFFGSPVDVFVERRHDGLVIRFVVEESAINDDATRDQFAALGERLAADLGGQIFVELTSPELELRVPVGWSGK